MYNFLIQVYRFLRYSNERKLIFKEIKIRRKQNKAISNYESSAKKLIIFFVPGCHPFTGKELVSGGVISIVSICEETTGLNYLYHAETIMCTLPGERLLFRHKNFVNNTDVYRFSLLVNKFKKLKEILIHIPEYCVSGFISQLSKKNKIWLSNAGNIHLNILNQNILMMPDLENIAIAKQLFSSVTITTAHQKYCTSFYRNLYGVPIHKLSVWISPEQYHFKK